jgi:hypothetical protein
MNKLVALSQTFPVVNLESPSNESGILNFYSTYSISMKALFRPETIYIMISKVFGSFDRYIQGVNALAQFFEIFKDHSDKKIKKHFDNMATIFEFTNILANVEQTMVGVHREEPFIYDDFLA